MALAQQVLGGALVGLRRDDEAIAAYEAALKKANLKYTAYMYKGANHGFHNDTTPRYDKEAAELAWKRTIEFFTANLS